MLGYAPPADARGGSKAESQATLQVGSRAARGGAKAKRVQRVLVPAGPLPPTVMAALARAHVPLSSMSVVVQRIGAPVLLVSLTQPSRCCPPRR